MKNYLLKIACLSTLCFGLFMISCSESDNDDTSDNQDQVDKNDDSANDGGQDGNGDDPSNGDNPNDGGETTVELTEECLICPGFTFNQSNSSGDITVVYLDGKVCKGEDGKAYYENGDPVDELGQTFEDHITFLESQARFCDPVE